MPEGPELHLASRFVNSVCKNIIFSGKVKKSEVSKAPCVDWDVAEYSISAESRGKELKLTLKESVDDAKTKSKAGKPAQIKIMDIIVRFGMSGRFRFDPVEEIHKHAHLNFYTKDKKSVLSFVDQRRFGSWEPEGTWGQERGPCILFEYEEFRSNVMSNLDKSVFNKAICEAMLDQKYFNGVGNYLRAEILYRAKIPPFVQARKVLEQLPMKHERTEKITEPDVLELTHTVSKEVIDLTKQSGYSEDASEEDSSAFCSWLQCYYQPGMQTLTDHNSRTMWFSGKAGPMAPPQKKARHQKGARKAMSKAAFEATVPKTEDLDSASNGHDVKDIKSSLPVTRTAILNAHQQAIKEEVPKPTKKRSGMKSNKRQEKSLASKQETSGIKVETSKPVKTKRTNAHDWPIKSPKKLRSSTRTEVKGT